MKHIPLFGENGDHTDIAHDLFEVSIFPINFKLLQGISMAALFRAGLQFNHRRLLEPTGNILPSEDEKQYYATLDEPAMAA